MEDHLTFLPTYRERKAQMGKKGKKGRNGKTFINVELQEHSGSKPKSKHDRIYSPTHSFRYHAYVWQVATGIP